MTGKLADTVMSVRNGEQIARKYQPVVFNPSTPAQIAQRAKMKLLSQLSAIVSFGIAFKRQGTVSARNLFTKANFKGAAFDSVTEKATIDVASLDLTGGVVALPDVNVTRSATKINNALLVGDTELDAVVYVSILEQADGKLRMLDMQVVDTPDTGYTFPSSDIPVDADINGYVLAYGIRYDSDSTRAAYSDLSSLTPSAFINVLRSDNSGAVTLTETKGTTFAQANRDIDPDDETKTTKKK